MPLTLLLLFTVASAGSRLDCAAAERDGRYGAMEQACDGCPTSAADETFCAGRLGWLRSHRDADGSYASVEGMARARRGLASVEDVAAIAADSEAATSVRVEAGLWLAQAEPDRAVSRLRAAREMAPESMVREVDLALAKALARAGQAAEAEAIEAPHRVGPTRPSPVQEVWVQRRRARVAGGAALVVVLFVAASLRVAGPRVRPLGVIPLTLLVAGSALYASLYAEGAGAGLWLFLPGVVWMHLLCARALTANPSVSRRLFAGVATLALGYLSLWWVDGLAEVGL